MNTTGTPVCEFDPVSKIFTVFDMFAAIQRFYDGYCLFHTVALLNKGCSQIIKNERIFKFAYETLAKKLSVGLTTVFYDDDLVIEDLIFGEQPCVVGDQNIIVFNKDHIKKYPTCDLTQYMCGVCGRTKHEILCGWCGRLFKQRDKATMDCKLYEDYGSDDDYDFCGKFNKDHEIIIRCKRKSMYLSNYTSNKTRAKKFLRISNLDEDKKTVLDQIIRFPKTKTYTNTTITYTFEASLGAKKYFGKQKMPNITSSLISVDFVKILQHDKESLNALGLVLKFEKYVETRGWPMVLKYCEEYIKGTYKHQRRLF